MGNVRIVYGLANFKRYAQKYKNWLTAGLMDDLYGFKSEQWLTLSPLLAELSGILRREVVENLHNCNLLPGPYLNRKRKES